MQYQQEIKKYLPDATDEQVEHFAIQVKRQEQLNNYFVTYPEDKQRFLDQLVYLNKLLNYKRPYRIAVIAVTGAGKSTLINALLGKSVVLTKTAGKAATGAVLEIFLDQPETEPEKAIIDYRDELNIRTLVKDFIQTYQRYGIDTSWLNRSIDSNFAHQLSTIEPEQKIVESETRNHFETYRKMLVDVVNQYMNHDVTNLQREFILDNFRDRHELNELIDENSTINAQNSATRIIGLIKTVTYHLRSPENKHNIETLQLPQNVCLVDLPGLDGSPLHNLIIREGIKDADAVIYMQKPQRIDTQSDWDLLSNISKYISLKGSIESNEGIFFVLNPRDGITEDKIPANFPKDICEQIEKFLPGYTKDQNLSKRGTEGKPYFLISALAALEAQKAMRGEEIENPNTYNTLKSKLGVNSQSDRELLEASQVPKLIRELSTFARDRRIEGQIRNSKMAIDNIVKPLFSEYENEEKLLTLNHGNLDIQKQEQIKQILEEKQKNLHNLVYGFRANQLANIERWQQELEKEAKLICNGIDNELKKNMPQLFEKALHGDWITVHPNKINRIMAEYIIDRTQIQLWKQITLQVPRIATYLVQVYSSFFESNQIADKISTSCYGYQEISQLEPKIQEWIDDMHHTMTEVGKRIALIKMTDPEFGFLTPEGKLEKRQLLEALPKPSYPNDLKLQDNDFHHFVTAVRKEYESFICGDCVVGMLNLFRYEMILIEDHILNLIKDTFYQISRLEFSELESRLLENMSNPTWERLKLVKDKITNIQLLM